MTREDYYYPSTDRIHMIHASIWKPSDARIIGVLQISHGMEEYILRYHAFAAFLTAYGIVVAGNDHLGHGDSVADTSELGYICTGAASAVVVSDLHKLTLEMKNRFPNVPYFLMGHSMGSFLARRYIMNYGQELTGAIIMGTGNQAPAVVAAGRALLGVIGALKGEHYKSAFANQLMFGTYNAQIKQPKAEYDWLSRDERIVEQYIQDEKAGFGFTINGLKMLLSTIQYVEKASNIGKCPKHLPLLMLSGEADPVGNYGKDVRRAYAAFRKAGVVDIQLKLYPDCRHELVNETNKEEIYGDILKWIQSHIL